MGFFDKIQDSISSATETTKLKTHASQMRRERKQKLEAIGEQLYAAYLHGQLQQAELEAPLREVADLDARIAQVEQQEQVMRAQAVPAPGSYPQQPGMAPPPPGMPGAVPPPPQAPMPPQAPAPPVAQQPQAPPQAQAPPSEGCLSCGAQVEPGTRFCSGCGADVGQGPGGAAPAPAPPAGGPPLPPPPPA